MKILMTHRYFWPDTSPYALMLRTIGAHLANDGHDVHVFATVPSYRSVGSSDTVPKRQTIDGLQIRRIFAFQEKNRLFIFRLINVLLYCAGLFGRIITLRPDVVTVSTFPPVIAAWTASLAAKLVGAKLIYHCQDIHPEVSLYSGGRMGRGVFLRLFRWLDNQTLRRAFVIVVLSDDMARTLRERNLGPLPITILNNFSLEVFDQPEPVPAAYIKRAGTCRILFAGNIGRFQNLIPLTQGIAEVLETKPDLELVFMGDGAAKSELEALWGGKKQIHFLPFLPYAQAQAVIADADIGLISLQPDVYRVAYPSKTATYRALGLPILACIEPHSALANDIINDQAGMVLEDLTPASIGKAIEQILLLKTPKHTLSISLDSILRRWDNLIKTGEQ